MRLLELSLSYQGCSYTHEDVLTLIEDVFTLIEDVLHIQ